MQPLILPEGVTLYQLKRLYEAKCQDLSLEKQPHQERRFIEYCWKNFTGRKFQLIKHGLGPYASKAIANILSTSNHFGRLNLRQNFIGDKGLQNIIKLLNKTKALVHLDISNNDLTQDGSKALLEAMMYQQSIIDLDISSHDGLRRNRLHEIGGQAARDLLRQNSILQILNLSGTSLGPKGILEITEGLQGNRSLASLNISNNDIGWKYIENFMSVLNQSAVKDLGLSENSLGDRGATIIADLLQINHDPQWQLTKLDISRNGIEKYGAVQLWKTLQYNGYLQILNLSHNTIGSAGTECMQATFKGNSTLTHLNLTDCNVGSEGCFNIGEAIAFNSSLKMLQLAINNWLNEGTCHIAKGIRNNKTLQYLDLTSNMIKDEGGIALAKCLQTANRSIQKLLLADNYFNDNVGYQLAEAARKNSIIVLIKLNLNPINNKYIRAMDRCLNRNLLSIKKHVVPRLKSQIGGLGVNKGVFEYYDERISITRNQISEVKSTMSELNLRRDQVEETERERTDTISQQTVEILYNSSKLTQTLSDNKEQISTAKREGEKAKKDIEEKIYWMNVEIEKQMDEVSRSRAALAIRHAPKFVKIKDLKAQKEELMAAIDQHKERIESAMKNVEIIRLANIEKTNSFLSVDTPGIKAKSFQEPLESMPIPERSQSVQKKKSNMGVGRRVRTKTFMK